MQRLNEHRVRAGLGRTLGRAAAALLFATALCQSDLAHAGPHGGGGGFHGGGGLLEVEGSGAVPGFHSSEQLRGYLTLHMAETQPVNWRFEPAATGHASAPDRVKWRLKLVPYAGGEVRSFVPPFTETIGDHRPITIEARLYLNGVYQTHVEETAIIEGGPDDSDLAAAVASLTQNLLSPSAAYHAVGLQASR
jgi:hypothetical protein